MNKEEKYRDHSKNVLFPSLNMKYILKLLTVNFQSRCRHYYFYCGGLGSGSGEDSDHTEALKSMVSLWNEVLVLFNIFFKYLIS